MAEVTKLVEKDGALLQVTGQGLTQTAGPAGPVAMMKFYAEKIQKFSEELAQTKARVQTLERDSPIKPYQNLLLEKARRKRVVHLLGGKESKAYQNKALASKTFRAIMVEYRQKFGVAMYQETQKSQYERAIHFYANWEPDFDIYDQIQQANEVGENHV